ncbi:MAG: hypothetical protein WC692_12355 [Erythrobacter sp.]|jgi:hypothetical protein
MNIDKQLRRALAAMLPLALVAGCADRSILEAPGDAAFGEANRQTMMAQVVNPEPEYDGEMTTSGDHAAQAIERYRADEVKQPVSIRTTDVGEGPE